MAVEDRRFYAHPGVDPHALLRAAAADLRRLRAAEGGSTITMQLARLVDPRPRTLVGKLVQVFRAFQLEEAFSKDEIVARYLARAPFGGSVRGAAAASRAWFGCACADLSPDEAALLVSVLPSPSRYSPRRDPAGARDRRDRVLDRMREEGFLDERACGAARARPIRLVAEPFPLVAAHAVARAGDGTTTIDARLEAACERVAAGVPAPDGVAIVVLDVATGRVRALVGATSADARVLDATGRPRSAGSTLKPFLYALAFDRGVAAPRHAACSTCRGRRPTGSRSTSTARSAGPCPRRRRSRSRSTSPRCGSRPRLRRPPGATRSPRVSGGSGSDACGAPVTTPGWTSRSAPTT